MIPKKSFLSLCAVSACFLIAPSVMAGSTAPSLKPVLAGKLHALEDTGFSESRLGPKWQAVKGEWKIEGGKLSGKELKSDKHAAVLNLNIPNKDLVIEFDFTVEAGKMFSLSFNKKQGHLWRLKADEKGFALVKDKDKKDPKSRPQVISTASPGLEVGKTYRLQTEFKGDEILIRSVDGSFKLGGRHPEFNQAKPNIRFVFTGESLAIDNLKVWELK